MVLISFFFQAEDGIRDLTVTGVQTCALPISRASPTGSITRRLDFVNPIAANPELCVVLLDRLPVGGIEDAVQLVLRLAEEDVVVRDAELVRGRSLRGAELVRRQGVHRMLVNELRHRAGESPAGTKRLRSAGPGARGASSEMVGWVLDELPRPASEQPRQIRRAHILPQG